ncbi:IclR family transcriptional regulator [Ancylobacter sp. A5.8]|uniref:IclR family transcriptional regulator n=1 Tax=Ancylobacter gelatini TaxID=2919920 RepID=UPI001F4DE6C6|nr:IclR family transcriptional regulator [Ancylobacter gelatini]MCJ8144001.1 IclR family transcriptional regulator [Ancylobacter gelatini]
MPKAANPDVATPGYKPDAKLSALGKGLAITRVVARSNGPVHANTLAAELGLSIPTTHRVLTELEVLGWVSRPPGGRGVVAGPEMLMTMALVASRDGFSAGLRASMRELMEATGETVCLNMIDRRSASLVVVAVEEPRRPLSYRLLPGETSPLHAGASGKAALAALDDAEARQILADHALNPITDATVVDPDRLHAQLTAIRREGFALSYGERLAGAVGLAVPLRTRAGFGFGSLLLTIPQFRFLPDTAPHLAQTVISHARRIEDFLVS